MDAAWNREVPPGKSSSDIAHVGAYDCCPGGIRRFHLKGYPPAIRQRLEDVGRCVLVYAHFSLAAPLYGRESRVRCGWGVARGAAAEHEQRKG